MRLADFDYNLPKELIAQYPLKERSSARLMVVDRAKSSVEHKIFSDFPEYLKKNDLLILNDTRVLSCRLKGNRITGGKVEILLLKNKAGLTFVALVKPARLRLKEKIIFKNSAVTAELSAKNEIIFKAENIDQVYALGLTPLPPYIKREPDDLDRIYYQTVYAREDGSVASPTAGLHFTDELLAQIKNAGINIGYLTLHVGLATFKPVACDDITQHPMSKEYFRIPEETLNLLERARLNSGTVCAVGTTSCRTLETYQPGFKEGETDLFIYPGYKFKIVDHLLTNFHLPKTTLFMLVSAFAGEKLIKRAYQEAIEKKYRFYSYGDAMLIL